MTAQMLIESFGKHQIKLGAMSWQEFTCLLDELERLRQQ